MSATAGVLSKSVQNGLKNTAQGFTLAAAGTPGFAKAIWPQGNALSQQYQEAQLDTMLEQAREKIGETLNEGLGVLMTDPWAFNNFGAGGQYSGQVQSSVPQQTNLLSLSLKTLLTGESLKQNRWFANASPTPYYWHEFQLKSRTDCTDTGNGVYSCNGGDGFYFSESTGRYYGLRHKKGGGKNSLNVLQQIASNGWADLNTLFDGAYNCTASGKYCGRCF